MFSMDWLGMLENICFLVNDQTDVSKNCTKLTKSGFLLADRRTVLIFTSNLAYFFMNFKGLH